MSVTGVNDYYGKRLDPMTRTLSLEEVARLRELTQYVQDMYADNERPETWQNDLLATYSAAARTKRNTEKEYQRDLHHYASEKGILPNCGRGAARKARNDDWER